MRSVYKTVGGHAEVRRWCEARLDAWEVPHHRETLVIPSGTAHLTQSGPEDGRVVVFVPGTNFTAATCLSAATALGARWSTVVVDLPGQPGLGSGWRPARPHHGWYGEVLAQVLEAADVNDAIVVGNSLGAAVALACDSPRVAGRVLYSPAGIARLRVDARLLRRSVPWLLRPSANRSRRLLELFCAPGVEPSGLLVEWMTLVARHCRTTLAPPPQPAEVLSARGAQPMVVATGERDRFLPPKHLARASRRTMNHEVTSLPGVGHLAVEERPGDLVALVEEVLTTVPARGTHDGR